MTLDGCKNEYTPKVYKTAFNVAGRSFTLNDVQYTLNTIGTRFFLLELFIFSGLNAFIAIIMHLMLFSILANINMFVRIVQESFLKPAGCVLCV